MKINERNLIYYANCNAPVDKEGWLMKRGEVNKGFQKRWFVLKGNLLFYFERQIDREPTGLIIVEGCTVELAELDSDSFTFQLVFTGPGSRSYILSSTSQEEMEAWMKAITCANYEYMKLMVSELQRQLEEITLADNSDIQETFRESIPPAGSQNDNTPIVDICSNSQSSNSRGSSRFNPFDSKGPTADAFGQPEFTSRQSASTKSDQVSQGLPKVPPRPSRNQPYNRVRTFDEMHLEFKENIDQKMTMKFGRSIMPSLVGELVTPASPF